MLELDLMLVHAPSVYDFRNRDDVLFAYLSNSDSVHVSPIFEMPPVGILAIDQWVRRQGMTSVFVNIASRMLRDPEFDVEEFFQGVNARYLGIDVHWLVHCHGALELTELYKRIHPESKTVLGGIASTYHNEELIRYPQIDYVIRGYDTLILVEQLLRSGNDPEALEQIPNLTWKQGDEVKVNPLTHAPRVFTAAVDWTQIFSPDRSELTPYNLVIPQAGCEYNCRWCGGGRYFFKKYMGLEKGPARVHKPQELLRQELQSIAAASTSRHTVTMIDFWHEYEPLFQAAEDVFFDDKIGSVHFSLHRLPKLEKASRMGKGMKAVFELSPDSHDLEVAKASGRGVYTMEEMEAFMDALIDDVYSFEIYFMIGLPKQSAQSVMETVEYCEHILTKYKGKRVMPYVCPMLPFLDPGSPIFDYPEDYGYTIFHHTVEDHRRALLSLNWKNRLNYETQWMTRDELVNVSYEAVRRLTLFKQQMRKLPAGFARSIVDLIDRTRVLLADIDAADAMPPGPEREAVYAGLRGRILEYNRKQLSAVRSQQRPVDTGFAQQQWFDTDEVIDRVLGHARAREAAVAAH